MTIAVDDDWTSASFRSALASMVKRRVPTDAVDDVVQATLTEAVACRDRPDDPEGARRWIWGVARHKIADYHRRAQRETGELPEIAAPPTPEEERDLLRWASRVLPPGPEAQRTFEWLLREGEGESLEDIASAERLPSPQVRQRVSRLRRLLRLRWAAQLAAAGLVAALLYLALRRRTPDDRIAQPRPRPPVVQESPEVLAARARGRALREEARVLCERSEWRRCVEGLDAARALDPSGDDAPSVRELRQRARDAIERERAIPPTPAPAPVVQPSSDRDGATGETPDGAVPRRRRRPSEMGSDSMGPWSGS